MRYKADVAEDYAPRKQSTESSKYRDANREFGDIILLLTVAPKQHKNSLSD